MNFANVKFLFVINIFRLLENCCDELVTHELKNKVPLFGFNRYELISNVSQTLR